MDCATFSRARERPLLGGPRLLRSEAEPSGLSTLQREDGLRVQEATVLAHFTARLAAAAHQAGGGV
eukprot:1336629-Amphidinium_carterae.1